MKGTKKKIFLKKKKKDIIKSKENKRFYNKG